MGIFDYIKDAITESIEMSKIDYDRLPDDLKKTLKQIEDGYSINPFQAVDLGMPETLGLEKLDYAEKSDEELQDLAKQYLASAYSSSYDKIESDYLKNANSADAKKDSANQNLVAKLAEAEENALKQKVNTENNTLKQGLARSSIKQQQLNDIDDNALKAKDSFTADNSFKIEALNKQIENLQEQKLSALKSLDTEYALKLDAKITDLLKQEQSARDAVTKYNNTVDEKEANYQKTLQSAYDAAIKAKYDSNKRLMEMTANLGQTYVNDLKSKDKFEAVKNFISESGMSREDALEFVSKDYTFKAQLGDKYYAELESWLKGKAV